MKGKILGFTAAAGTGVITGENGERFSFAATQWRSDKPIAPGMTVDFDAREGVATEVYPVTGGMAFNAADVTASPAIQKARGLVMTTLAVPLAILLLIATLLPALSSPIQSVSLWGMGGIVKLLNANPMLSDDGSYATERLAKITQEDAELKADLTRRGLPMPSAAEIAAAPAATMFGDQSFASRFKELGVEREKLGQQIADARWRNLLASLMIVRFLVPIGACVLLYLAWVAKPLKIPSIATGGIAIVTAAIIYLYRDALIGHSDKDSIGAAISAQMDAVVSVGFGTYLIALIGIGLILAGIGVVRNPLAAKV
ncbi:hypothetical protein [uncultured Sphingomonas sp.]|uniref:hypothetical protein n=1 Tax=uncultured Sphingomonas sp. TaxID=158754 RepID=UPI0035C99203